MRGEEDTLYDEREGETSRYEREFKSDSRSATRAHSQRV